MADLTFVDSHNLVSYLEKSKDNADFAEIVDFLNASPIGYALTVSPNVYVSYIEQFWSTGKIKIVNNETQIRAKVDGKTIVITESSVRRYLHFNDEDGIVTPLFATMLIQSQAVEGEGSGQPTEPQHTPTTASPSHATEISQSSGPTTLVADETIHKGRGDSVERDTTTATSLDSEQGGGNINRTQSTAIPNVPFPHGIGSSGSPRYQESIGDTIAQTRSERDAQALEIKRLKKRVKKLESKKKSRTPQLKRRLFKVRIESSAEKSLGDKEDSSKQGRNEIDQYEGISCINITTVEPVTTASAPVTAGVYVSTAEPSTPPITTTTTTTTTPIEDEDLIISQTLMKMKSEKSKEKGVTMQEPSESGIRVRVPPPQINPKDKGKAKMVEPEKPKKKKDQIEYDADVAKRFQAELDEEARLEREREVEASKAANIAEWDDVQAMMDADYELASKL
ncbi:hypothetical protein Tco_1243326 [Tanacetum coccineum]